MDNVKEQNKTLPVTEASKGSQYRTNLIVIKLTPTRGDKAGSRGKGAWVEGGKVWKL